MLGDAFGADFPIGEWREAEITRFEIAPSFVGGGGVNDAYDFAGGGVRDVWDELKCVFEGADYEAVVTVRVLAVNLAKAVIAKGRIACW